MKVCLAGQGAFGIKHLEAIQNIPGIEVVTLAGGRPAGTEGSRQEVEDPALDEESDREPEARRGGDPRHPDPGSRPPGDQAMRAGKHVLIEIPMIPIPGRHRAILNVPQETGVVAMAGHIRRFNPSHQYIHKKITAGELKI